MADDSVVHEVRRIREEIFAEVDFDLRRLGERLRQEDHADSGRVVDLARRKANQAAAPS